MKQPHKIKDVLFYIYCRFPNIKLTDNSTVSYAQTKFIWYLVFSARNTSWPSYHQERSTTLKHMLGSMWTVKSPHKWLSSTGHSATARRVLVYRLRTETSCCVLLTLGNSDHLSVSTKGHKSSVGTGFLRLQTNFIKRPTLHPECIRDMDFQLSLTS